MTDPTIRVAQDLTAIVSREPPAQIRYNRSEPRRCANTDSALTHSLDVDKEGLAMNATRTLETSHPQWQGRVSDYQRAALQKYAADTGRQSSPWSWIRTACATSRCMRVQCMRVHSPVRIAYPSSLCVYCGNIAGTKDHLLPRAWTGDAGQRGSVALVPACAECNSIIRDSFAVSVTDRREIAHNGLRRKHRRLMEIPDKSPSELKELGYAMRTVAVKNNRKREAVRQRLAWPVDPDYDRRAFQHSGIAEPESLGLI